MTKDRLFLFWILFAAIMFTGCASVSNPDAKPVFWPGFPNEPRIAYIKSLASESDIRKNSFLDALFGTSPGLGLGKAYGVFARDGKVYVTSTSSASVIVFDQKEHKVSAITGEGMLRRPIGVVVSIDGTIFVSDGKKKNIYAFDQKGKLKRIIETKDFNNPSGMAINDTLGRLYIADSYGHCVHAFSLNGEKLFTFGKNGDGDGEFNFPSNVAVDRKNGKVYVVDTQNFRVQVFDQDGKFIRKFGELRDSFGGFSRPKGIGVDTEGHVYVVDAAFDNFQIFDEDSRLLLFIGEAGDRPGYFNLPAGMYVDEDDKIYVVDTMNWRVQIFQYLSEKWKKENPAEYRKFLPSPEKPSDKTISK